MKFYGFSQVAGAMLAPSWDKKPSWELSWPSWRPSWAHFSAEGRLKSVLARLGAVLGASWRRLGSSWRRLGSSWRRLGAQGRVGPGLAWNGKSDKGLKTLRANRCCCFGVYLSFCLSLCLSVCLSSVCGRLRACWARLGGLLEASWSCLRACRSVSGPPWRM